MHFKNASFPRIVTLEGSTIEVRDVQSEKALRLTLVTLSAILTDVRFSQVVNA